MARQPRFRLGHPGDARNTSWPAARSQARSRYRGGVARKSRPRGGTTPARTAAPQAGTAQLTAPAGTDPDAAAVATDAAPAQNQEHPYYPGQRFGLPERGPGSVASMGRRLLALLIDWLLCMVIAYWLTHSQFWTIVVFAIEDYVLTALTGSTVGKRLLGIRVVRVGGGLVGLRWALVRTAILLTVVPPLLTDRDLRGLHDRASDTIVIRF
jgi:hypothetical protein